MADITFNDKGAPLMATCKSGALITTTGGPRISGGISKPKKYNFKTDQSEDRVDRVADISVWSWGTDNKFPESALTWIEKTTVLSSGLLYKIQLLMGQGVFPAEVIGYNEDGSEILKVVEDKNVNNIVRSAMVRRYLAASSRDLFKFGMAFPILQFNEKGDAIVNVFVQNARSCRWEETKDGVVRDCIIADWRNPKKTFASRVHALDRSNPELDMAIIIEGKKTEKLNIVYSLENYFGNNYYYQIPAWYVAYNAGWMDISSSIPSFLKKVYENQISWKWHIKIPYAYWDKKYPENKYATVEERKTAIEAEMQKIEDNLTGTDNAHKAIFTMFEIGVGGKPEEQWIIETLDNKYKTDQQMIESAVADSNILFAINVNPTVMGAGLPGAGPYAGKTGGSDIRESFLVNVALTWLDRQNILDPLEMMLKINGYKDVQLRFRNTILTTLDSGGGTSKVVS